MPSMLSPRGVTDSNLPTFVWSTSTDNDDPLLGYRLVIDGGPPIVLGPTTTTYTPEAALSPGGHSWCVTAVETDDEYTQVDPALLPAVVRGRRHGARPARHSPGRAARPTTTRPRSAGAAPSPDRSSTGSSSAPERTSRSSTRQQGNGTAELAKAFQELDDGAYAFIVRQRQFPFQFGAQALNVFTIDTTPPAQVQVTTRPAPIGTEPSRDLQLGPGASRGPRSSGSCWGPAAQWRRAPQPPRLRR